MQMLPTESEGKALDLGKALDQIYVPILTERMRHLRHVNCKETTGQTQKMQEGTSWDRPGSAAGCGQEYGHFPAVCVMKWWKQSLKPTVQKTETLTSPLTVVPVVQNALHTQQLCID